MRTLRRKVLAVFMAVLLGMASFAVLAEEPLESEIVETVETVESVESVESVSNGNGVIYDKASEDTGDTENEDKGDRDGELEDLVEVVETEGVASDDDAVMDMATPEELDFAGEENVTDMDEADLLAGDQVIVYAADDIASGVDGDITWVIDASGKLTVNGTGDLSGDRGASNFAWRPYSSQITFAEINVSDMTDASCLFFDCGNLLNVDLSGLDTSRVTDMGWMFCGCSSLVSVDMSGFDTSSVINMECMFWECSNLSSVDMSGLNTSSVTNMALMFDGCSNLLSVDISGFDTGSVTNMACMFEDCSSLVSVDVSGFDTRNVESMGAMFYGCSSLSHVDVSGFDTRNVGNMEAMFYGCSSLVSVDVSKFATSNVTRMADMFSGCSSLASVDVSGFDTGNVESMGGMFYGCSSLTSVDVSGFDTGNVESMGGMFYGCSSLTSVDVSGFDTSKVVDMSIMFRDCRGLLSVDASGFDTGSVVDMSSMFAGCSSLSSVDVSNFDTSNVKDMRLMFYGCSNLLSIDASEFDTSNVMDMGWMFCACSNLVSLDVSGFDMRSVRDATYMLSNCNNLTTINSPICVRILIGLPLLLGTTWNMPDGTEVTELPQNLSYSITLTRTDELIIPQITTTTDDLNMANVIRVKYVPYSYTVATDNTDAENTVTFSIVEGTLAEGLQISPATGEIYGVPLEAGEFKITVMASYSNPEYPPSYAELTLIILDNTDDNVGAATDPGYDITQPVVDFNMDAISGEGTQTLVSQGEYAQFQHIVYIDGKLLEEGEGKDYSSEAGNTRITIQNQTLADGGVGTHTLCLVFRAEDGTLKRAAQNYTVSSGSFGDDSGNDKPGDECNGDKNPENENTDEKPPIENLPSNSGDSSNSSNSGNNSNSSNNSKGDTTSIDLVKNTVDAGNVTEVAYTIVSGDTLWKIADRFYGSGTLWTKIFADNADIIKDANKIYVGQVIRLYIMDQLEQASISAVPTTTSIPLGDTGQLPIGVEAGEVYVVQTGDSLWKIAAKLYGDGHKWRSIYAANQDVLRAPGKIYAGQRLIIPDK